MIFPLFFPQMNSRLVPLSLRLNGRFFANHSNAFPSHYCLRAFSTTSSHPPQNPTRTNPTTTRTTSQIATMSTSTTTEVIPKYGPFTISDKVKDEVSKLDVWTIFSPATGWVPKDSINLGQGFMNWAPAPFVQQAAIDAVKTVEANHYSHARGRIRLRKALSNYLSPTFFPEGSKNEGRKLDPETEVLVTSGANEGIYAFLAAFLRPQEEVILFEPFFDQFVSNTTFNNGVPVYVPLLPPGEKVKGEGNARNSGEWKIDWERLRGAITERTKVIIINTPHNPIGKVFTEDELRKLGKIAEEFNILILADEVYDCLALNGNKHTRIASLDNFWERTVTVGSAGKSFAATGWRIGWLTGPAHLIRPSLAATTRIVFSCNSPCSEATAAGLEQAEELGFWDKQRGEYEERLEVVEKGLGSEELKGLEWFRPEGAYYVVVDVSKVKIDDDFVTPDFIKPFAQDFRTCWFIAQKLGVVLIPCTAFYDKPHWSIGEKYVRISFCKDTETLKKGMERLKGLGAYIRE